MKQILIAMPVVNEVTSIAIPVAHYHSFDLITNEAIPFRIFKDQDCFKAVPQASPEECRLAGIPQELIFIYRDHVVLDANNMDEDVIAVIKNIILELEVLEIV